MGDNPTGFQSWDDYLALNGDQEQQLLDRAMSNANQTRADATHTLSRAGDDAMNAQMKESRLGQGGNAGGVATTTLSTTGSYGDYLKLKLKAEGQYRAAQNGGNAVSSLVRKQRAQQSGVNDAWTQQGDALEAKQAMALRVGEAGAASYTRQSGEEKGRYDAKVAADEARKQEDAMSTTAFNASVEAAQAKTDDRLFHRDPNGIIDPNRLNQMRLSQIQRSGGFDATGKKFDPFSKEGRRMRSSAYGGWTDDGVNRFNPDGYQDRSRVQTHQMDSYEKTHGSYGKG